MAKEYSKIKAKDNMKISEGDNGEEVVRDKKKLDKLIDVQPVKRKRGLMSRLVSGVLGPEGLPGIGSYVNDEIIVPAIKNIIVDAVTSGINMVMYGDSKPRGGGHAGYSRNRSSSSSYRPTTNYQSRYAQTEPAEQRRAQPRSSRYGVDEYIIDERFDAAHVLTALTEYADMYETVSIADYYELIGVPSQHTDNTYGWTMESILEASVVPIRGGQGYIIKFPPVEVI